MTFKKVRNIKKVQSTFRLVCRVVLCNTNIGFKAVERRSIGSKYVFFQFFKVQRTVL